MTDSVGLVLGFVIGVILGVAIGWNVWHQLPPQQASERAAACAYLRAHHDAPAGQVTVWQQAFSLCIQGGE